MEDVEDPANLSDYGELPGRRAPTPSPESPFHKIGDLPGRLVFGDPNYAITAKDKAATICPQLAAAISVIGSYIIIREVLKDHRLKRGEAVPRVLLAMSFADVIFSLGWFLGSWPCPSEITYLWGNVGNIATCNFQGFLIQFGLMASPLFNISLAFFFLLMVRYNWSDNRLRKLEPWIHGSIWTFALAASIFPIPLELYNTGFTTCWFESGYEDCGEGVPCTRGEDAWIYAVAFTVFPVLTCVMLSAVIMGMIYCYVHETEKKSRRYAGSQTATEVTPESSSSQTANHREAISRSRIVATQGMFYCGGFLLTYTLHSINTLVFYTTDLANYWFYFFSNLLLPLQGLFNAMVFVRNREMKTPEGKFFKRLVCCKIKLFGGKGRHATSATAETTQSHLSAEQREKMPSDGVGLEDSK
jgi:hypothetical protein